MANKITDYYGGVINQKVSNATLLNLIRSNCSAEYQRDIPMLDDLKPINHANVPYAQYEVHQNEFFNVLVNKIGTTVIKALEYEQPWAVFYSEDFEYGETLEEIYVGLADSFDYDAKDATSPFAYADTDIHVFYHDKNREKVYERTFNKQWVMKAFKSEFSFDAFIDKMFASFITSDNLDVYTEIRDLVTKSLTPINVGTAGTPIYISTPATEFDFQEDDFVVRFNKELIARSNMFTIPSRTRFENGAGVPNATPIEDQYLLVTASFSAELDSLLANAFNMDKATVLAHKIIVDEFPAYEGAGDLNGAIPFAALVSKDSFIVKDNLLEMNNIFNPRTLNYNYFLHHQQLISYSLFENAHIYYTMPAAA